MAIEEIILRTVSFPPLVTTGDRPLTWEEEDNNFIVIYQAIANLQAGSSDAFEEYDPGREYEDGDFVSFDGNIWKFINPIPQTGVAPGSDPASWEISSIGQFTHQQNTDQYLDFGGPFQVSAEDLYGLLNTGITGYSFENGLTETAGIVRFGGTLTDDTFLDGDFTYFAVLANLAGFSVTSGDADSIGADFVTLPDGDIQLISHDNDNFAVAVFSLNYSNGINLSYTEDTNDPDSTQYLIIDTGGIHLKPTAGGYATILIDDGMTGDTELKLPLSSGRLSVSNDNGEIVLTDREAPFKKYLLYVEGASLGLQELI